MDTFLFFIKQGFFHVIDINALDHVLFFISLTIIYQLKSWKKALWLITFFTIGHSITFSLSTYNLLDVDVNLVEFLIPITILIPLILTIYKAYNDDFLETKINSYFSFFFGLIHGLGFSNYFKILLDDSDSKLIPLINFALGIELAQIIIVLFVLLLSLLIIDTIKVKRKYWIISVSLLVFIRIIPMLITRYPY